MTDINTLSDVEIMARTIWGESRGEGLCGMCAVACVIMNRVNIGKSTQIKWWGDDVREICLKPYQFSCWLESDPNRAKLLSKLDTDAVYSKCLVIASLAIKGLLNDPTRNATHYFDNRMSDPPKWAVGLEPTIIIGHHSFYHPK